MYFYKIASLFCYNGTKIKIIDTRIKKKLTSLFFDYL